MTSTPYAPKDSSARSAKDGSSARSAKDGSSGRAAKAGGDAAVAVPKRLCTFWLGPTLYGFDVRIVRRIVALGGVIPVPGAPFGVMGVQMVHGAALPVVNVPAVLQLPITGDFAHKPTTALLLDLGHDVQIAAAIDRVEAIIDLHEDRNFRRRAGDAEHEAVFGIVEMAAANRSVTVLASEVLIQKVQALRFRTS